MIALAALVFLPYRALLGVSVAIIALHNLFDRLVPATSFGAFALGLADSARNRACCSRRGHRP